MLEENPSKELIFFQSGPLSNWVGTHLWNHLTSISSKNPIYQKDTFFVKNHEYMPRLMAFDIPGNIGVVDYFDSNFNTNTIWDGTVEVFQDKSHESNKVSLYWSDCLNSLTKDSIFKRSLNIFTEYQSCPGVEPFNKIEPKSNSDPNSFVSASQGLNLFNESFEKIEDSLRKLSEACDWLNGFISFSDCASGFSGLSMALNDHLFDEYGKKSLFSFPIQPHQEVVNFLPEVLYMNMAWLMSRLESSEDSLSHSIYCPLLFDAFKQPNLCSNSQLLSHSVISILLSLSMESTIPYRKVPLTLDSIVSDHFVNSYSKKMINMFTSRKSTKRDFQEHGFTNPWTTEDDINFFKSSSSLPKYIFSNGMQDDEIDDIKNLFNGGDQVTKRFSHKVNISSSLKPNSCCCYGENFNSLSLSFVSHRCNGIDILYKNLKSKEMRILNSRLDVEKDMLDELSESVKNFVDKYLF